MTDRELLELAAKAAGIASDGLGGCYDIGRESMWNPLEDDGEIIAFECAFRLEVE